MCPEVKVVGPPKEFIIKDSETNDGRGGTEAMQDSSEGGRRTMGGPQERNSNQGYFVFPRKKKGAEKKNVIFRVVKRA